MQNVSPVKRFRLYRREEYLAGDARSGYEDFEASEVMGKLHEGGGRL